jgi:hypothetical protein
MEVVVRSDATLVSTAPTLAPGSRGPHRPPPSQVEGDSRHQPVRRRRLADPTQMDGAESPITLRHHRAIAAALFFTGSSIRR